MQRFVWDLHYPPPKAQRYDFPISANYLDTPRTPQGPLVAPGTYNVRLTVGKVTLGRQLTVRVDPRVTASPLALRQQFQLSMQAYDGMNRSFDAMDEVRKLRARVKDRRGNATGARADELDALDKKLATLGGGGEGVGQGGAGTNANEASFAQLNSSFESLLELLQSADAQPTTQAAAAVADLERKLADALSRLNAIKSGEAKSLED
jgi:hypothetical protein